MSTEAKTSAGNNGIVSKRKIVRENPFAFMRVLCPQKLYAQKKTDTSFHLPPKYQKFAEKARDYPALFLK
jgi:hypothetical protein